ncbi:MAG: hypothetical protein JHC93_05420 [Parachlamydiales bacterium]|nr:hypothetical protein [Parachlamydiales bacterium]
MTNHVSADQSIFFNNKYFYDNFSALKAMSSIVNDVYDELVDETDSAEEISKISKHLINIFNCIFFSKFEHDQVKSEKLGQVNYSYHRMSFEAQVLIKEKCFKMFTHNQSFTLESAQVKKLNYLAWIMTPHCFPHEVYNSASLQERDIKWILQELIEQTKYHLINSYFKEEEITSLPGINEMYSDNKFEELFS